MKFGIFTASAPEYYPLELMDVLAKIGYDGIEWRVARDKGDKSKPSFWSGNRAGLSAEEIITQSEALCAKAKALNLEMPSLASYINNDNLEDVALHFKAANSIGARNVRISPNLYDVEAGGYVEQLAKCKVKYAKVAKLAEQYGVRAIIETHMQYLCSSVYQTMAILGGLNPAYVGIGWDPCNQVYEGRETYEMALDIAGEYLAEVHVKNCVYKRDEEGTFVMEDCPVNSGLVDWKKIVGLLKKQGYNGWLFFEDFSQDKPLLDKLTFNLPWFRGLITA